MSRWKKVPYGHIVKMIKKAVQMYQTPKPLSQMVDEIGATRGLSIDAARIKRSLGSQCVEKVELHGDVTVVKDYVVPTWMVPKEVES